MLAKERQAQIVSQVEQNGSVKVKELSEQFSVTEDCIRKDLTLLEKNGLLKKTYGGAVQVKINVHNFDVAGRRELNIDAKQRIAQNAMPLLSNGDMIFLDISTSALEMARLVAQSSLRITVVTNMVDIMLEFRKPTAAQLICVGGRFNHSYDGFTGAQTIEKLLNYRFDIAFLGTVGVDPFKNEVTTYDVEDGLTKKAVMERSRKAYMLAESKKLNEQGDCKYADVDDFTGIILEVAPPEKIYRKLAERNLVCIY